MKLRRREAEMFSLSFLDCICCGFGAIILLLVLTDVDQPVVIERATASMNGQILKLQEELFALRGETDELHRELQGRITELREQSTRLVRLQADLSNVQGEYAASSSEAQVAGIVENELVAAYQELTAEMERLQNQPRPRNRAGRGGRHSHRQRIRGVRDRHLRQHGEQPLGSRPPQIMNEALDIYPRLKGLQVINDQGRYMFEDLRRASGSPTATRCASASASACLTGRPSAAPIRCRASSWRCGSIRTAGPARQHLRDRRRVHRRLHAGRRRSASPSSMPRTASGRARASTPSASPQGAGMAPFTNMQFSALMRVVTAQNGGTFVGITSEKPCRYFTEILGTRQCVGD